MRLKNLWAFPGAFKIPELALAMIIMIMTREGANVYEGDFEGYIPWGGSIDSVILGDMVAFGYFVIITSQFFGYMCAEMAMVQNFLLNLVGSCCYLAIGAVHIQFYRSDGLSDAQKAYQDLCLANGSLAIIQGTLMLFDAGYCLHQIVRD